jgi:hypothetical protein
MPARPRWTWCSTSRDSWYSAATSTTPWWPSSVWWILHISARSRTPGRHARLAPGTLPGAHLASESGCDHASPARAQVTAGPRRFPSSCSWTRPRNSRGMALSTRVPLRTRIALTFLLLLTAVLTAALYAVSAANRRNAEPRSATTTRCRRLGVHAAARQQPPLADASRAGRCRRLRVSRSGLRHDTETLNSALENSGARVGAALVVLTSLDGHVLAASGSHAAAGSLFSKTAGQRAA